MSSLTATVDRLERRQRSVAREAAREAVRIFFEERGEQSERRIGFRLQLLLATVAVGELLLATVLAVHTLT